MRHKNSNKYRIVCFLLLAPAGTPVALPQDQGDEESTRLYTTSQERREAGVEHELAPGFTASGLLELDAGRERLSGQSTEHNDNSDATIQLGLKASRFEPVLGEVVLELGTEKDELIVDEAIIELDIEPWGLALGRQYLPFGVYFSRFATDPLLEFAETRATAATLSYELTDRIDVSASLYRGRARSSENGSHEMDWALAVDARPTKRWSIGVSYLDDLAQSDADLLMDEENQSSRKVPALGAYALWSGEEFAVSFEALGATRSFSELDSDRDRPAAWNFEFTHFTAPRFDSTLRVEGSRELGDFPEIQYGAAANFGLHRRVSLTLEILRGHFRGELAVDDNEDPFRRVTRAGLLLSVAF